ncbi:MAG TPA: hypothetical protein V6C58_04930 [Allocoleopsis sp.]
MKAIESKATINDQGQILLDQPLKLSKNSQVRAIALIPEDEENDPDDTPDEVVLEGFRQGLQDALTGKIIPLSEMWKNE